MRASSSVASVASVASSVARWRRTRVTVASSSSSSSSAAATPRRVALVVDDDSPARVRRGVAHPELVAAAIRTLPGVSRCDVVVAGDARAEEYDVALRVPGGARGDEDEEEEEEEEDDARRATGDDDDDNNNNGSLSFVISVLATTRSKKRTCVALEPLISSETLASSRAFNEGARLCAERAFCDGGLGGDEEYATYAGVVSVSHLDDVPEFDDLSEDKIKLTRIPATESRSLESLLVAGAKCGLPVELVMEHLMKNSMYRSGVPKTALVTPSPSPSPPLTTAGSGSSSSKMKVYVIFGGSSSQRRQSCESGRHVYLTLKRIPTIDVIPVVLNNFNNIGTSATTSASGISLADAPAWRLTYANALDPDQWDAPRAPDVGRFAPSKRVRADLEKYGWVKPSEIPSMMMINNNNSDEVAARVTRLGALLAVASREGAIIFNAMHGGAGEDGSLQQLCVSSGVAYTGSSPLASRVCMDKAATAKALAQRPVAGVTCLHKRVVPASTLVSKASDERGWGGRERTEGAKRLWLDIVSSLGNPVSGVVVKPIADGASYGIRRLMDENDMLAYAEEVVAASTSRSTAYVFEQFFDASSAPWMECSFTLMGALGNMQVYGDFDVEQKIKERAKAVSDVLGIEGFAVLDAFVNTETGELIVIEINTVPDMKSPDSVVFARAKRADPPVDPETFCTRALSLALVRRFRR